MPQQQAECAPTGFTEAHQKPPIRVTLHRIGSFDERDNHLDKIAFLADLLIGWMIRVPGQVRKRRIDANELVLIVDTVRPNLLHRFTPPLATAGLDRQDVQHLVFLTVLQAIRKEHSDLRRTCLKLGLYGMDQTS